MKWNLIFYFYVNEKGWQLVMSMFIEFYLNNAKYFIFLEQIQSIIRMDYIGNLTRSIWTHLNISFLNERNINLKQEYNDIMDWITKYNILIMIGLIIILYYCYKIVKCYWSSCKTKKVKIVNRYKDRTPYNYRNNYDY